MKLKNAPEVAADSVEVKRTEVLPPKNIPTPVPIDIVQISPPISPEPSSPAPSSPEPSSPAPDVDHTLNLCHDRCGRGTVCLRVGCVSKDSCNNACGDTQVCREGNCVRKDECGNKCGQGTVCKNKVCVLDLNEQKNRESLRSDSALKVEEVSEKKVERKTSGPGGPRDTCDGECNQGTWCFKGECRRSHKFSHRFEFRPSPSSSSPPKKIDGCNGTCGADTRCDWKTLECISRWGYRVETEGPWDSTCDTSADCYGWRNKCDNNGWCQPRSFRRIEPRKKEISTEKECFNRQSCIDKYENGNLNDWICLESICYWTVDLEPGKKPTQY